jgi:hypothetical protein
MEPEEKKRALYVERAKFASAKTKVASSVSVYLQMARGLLTNVTGSAFDEFQVGLPPCHARERHRVVYATYHI